MTMALDRNAWRESCKNNDGQTDHISFRPNWFGFPDLALSRRIEKKFRATWNEGTVYDHDVDANANELTWRAKYDDGDEEDMNRAALLAVMSDPQDQLERATAETVDPATAIGARVMKMFKGHNYAGTIRDCDIDRATGCAMWGVLFDDGDEEDFSLLELRIGRAEWARHETERQTRSRRELQRGPGIST